MENFNRISSSSTTHDEPIELPPGFRFHPTDEELITHYLCPKVLNTTFTTKVIGDVDLNKVEPWELPWKAKMGEKEWYFFCVRDRKYPTGLRTNRATEAGYWKATGKDKEIFQAKKLVGMKKTLVFYKGRAPRGEKTNWVMHEYRLDGTNSGFNLPKTAKNEWVISRIFKKSPGGKKVHISGLIRSCDFRSDLPPLTGIAHEAERLHVSCFSNSIMDEKSVEEFSSCSKNDYYTPTAQFIFSKSPNLNSGFSPRDASCTVVNSNCPHSISLHDHSVFGVNDDISNLDVGFKPYDDDAEPVEFDCLWNY
ncbi:hypothetical protein ABFS83_11G116500 [Erythranthe nasuta]